MAEERPVNLGKPALTVYYLNLKRAEDGVLRSHCPFCAEGALLIARDPKTLKMIDQDHCISCGQAVVYADLREAFPPGDDETKESRYNRDAGFPCRVCGHTVKPVFQGNTLVAFFCTHCNEEFMP